MRKIRTPKSKIIWIFCGILFLVIINGNNFGLNLLTNNNTYNSSEINLKNAGYRIVSPITIVGNSGWETANSTYDWITGSGTWIDPYVIENISIDGDRIGNCIEITGSDVFFTINNCTFFNSGGGGSYPNYDSGIKLSSTKNGILRNNNASLNIGVGILLQSCENITISGNIVNDNLIHGIFLSSSNIGNNVIGNNASYNQEAGIIVISSSNYNNISRNNVINNSWAGFYCSYSNYNNIFDNTINNRQGHYGLILSHSNQNNVYKNNLKNHYKGIMFWDFASYNVISNNNITYSSNMGIEITDDSCFNVISDNNISYNEYNGIDITEDSNFNNITSNIISFSDNYGIYIHSPGYKNFVIFNNFFNNSVNAQDSGDTTFWNNDTHGNYWQDYLGVDIDDNGIGDTPYSIIGSAGSQDNFPIWRDSDDIAPQITITTPNPNDLMGKKSPTFNIKITDQTLNSTWYRLWNGTTLTANTSFEYLFDNEIDQNIWNEVGNDTVTITFFANDSIGRLTHKNVTVRKDLYNPVITVNEPNPNDLFGSNAPDYDLTVIDGNLHSIWYTLDGGATNSTPVSAIGTIDQTMWDAVGNGTVTIRFYANNTAGNINYEEVLVRKDIIEPTLLNNSPNSNDLFGSSAPDYDLTVTDANLHSIWYTLDGGATNSTPVSASGTIDQAMWSTQPNGTVTIRFYANDTLGNINYEDVIVRKDIIEPILTINSPSPNDLFGTTVPDYDLTVIDSNLDSIWYSLNGGLTNSTPVTITGTIDQTMWSALGNGTATIRFYANDTAGNLNYEEIIIQKDIISPSITINSPSGNDLFGSITPHYDLTVIDSNLDSIWYTLDGGGTNSTSISASGTIDLTLWNTRSNGTVTVRFYANDTLGNINYEEVMVRKDIIEPSITINSPNLNNLFGTSAPDYDLTILDANLDSLWYELANGTYTTINTSFTLFNGIINQLRWDEFGNGTVIIRFYANDTLGNLAFQEVTVRKDIYVPVINIILPNLNQLCGKTAPYYNITVSGSNIDAVWYSLDDGATNFTFSEVMGTINQTAWDLLVDGFVVIKFYINNTLGVLNYDEITVIKDTSNPIVSLNNPNPNDLFSSLAPDFDVTISDSNGISAQWYTFDGGITNYTFVGSTGTINQASWDLEGNGTVLIRFYANDSISNVGYLEIIVRKDILAPIITINTPITNLLFGIGAPSYALSIIEANLDMMWYTLDNGINNITITELTGMINQDLWEEMPNGYITIKFYVNDTLGNLSFEEVIVVKDTPTTSPSPPGIPGYNILLLLGIVSTIAVIIIKKRLNHLN